MNASSVVEASADDEHASKYRAKLVVGAKASLCNASINDKRTSHGAKDILVVVVTLIIVDSILVDNKRWNDNVQCRRRVELF